MFKSLIAGVAALGLIATTAPNKAEAGDNDVLRGLFAGAIILGTIAALDKAYDNDRHRRHSHSHVRSKPNYGDRSNRVYRHGTRIYSNRDTRQRHDDYGRRHRGEDRHWRRNDDYRHKDRGGNRHKGDGARKSVYHSHGDYRHKNHKGQTSAHRHKNGGKKHVGQNHNGRKHVGNNRQNVRPKQVQRLRAKNERLVHDNARLRRQLERRERYVQSLHSYDQ